MKVLFVGEGTVSDSVRCELPATHLNKIDVEAKFTIIEWRDRPVMPLEGFDAVILSRPHHDSLMLAYKRMGVKLIVDMDDDFHAIPETHPGYQDVGRGDPYYLSKLDNCIYLADMVTTTTSLLRERLLPLNKNIRTIPNGWSADNFNWLVRRSIHRDRFVFGWGGTITHREDFKICVKPLQRILKEHSEAMVCIVGDVEIYKMLAGVHEKQKMFIPMMPYFIYPVSLSLWDVLLAPLIDNEFNQAKSDIKLVDAGAKGIPYICSDICIYRNWPDAGHKIPNEEDAWYQAMTSLISSPTLYAQFAREGQQAARMREMNNLAKVWKGIIEEVLDGGR